MAIKLSNYHDPKHLPVHVRRKIKRRKCRPIQARVRMKIAIFWEDEIMLKRISEHLDRQTSPWPSYLWIPKLRTPEDIQRDCEWIDEQERRETNDRQQFLELDKILARSSG